MSIARALTSSTVAPSSIHIYEYIYAYKRKSPIFRTIVVRVYTRTIVYKYTFFSIRFLSTIVFSCIAVAAVAYEVKSSFEIIATDIMAARAGTTTRIICKKGFFPYIKLQAYRTQTLYACVFFFSCTLFGEFFFYYYIIALTDKIIIIICTSRQHYYNARGKYNSS